MTCPFDVGDEVMCGGVRRFVRQTFDDGATTVFLEWCMTVSESMNSCIGDNANSKDCELITPAKWRLNDIVKNKKFPFDNSLCFISNVSGDRVEISELNGKFRGEFYVSSQYWVLHERPGVKMWQGDSLPSANKSRKNCQDCKTKGYILLLTGRVDCDCIP